MASYTDLSGMFYVQKALLNDISTQLSNTDNIEVNNNLYEQVQKMQADLDNYNMSFQTANESSSQVLSRQDDVQRILDDEYNRLVMKQMNIDNAVQGRRRGAFLNDNYKQRYSQYTKIIIIFICTLVSIYLLTTFKDVIPLPDYGINFIMFVIIVIAGMMCYFTYMTILVRDKIYFDELNIPPPPLDISNNPVDLSGNPIDNTKYSKFSLPGFGLCVDSDCCSVGTVWDENSYTCVASGDVSTGRVATGINNTNVGGGTNMNSQGFTTLDQAYVSGDIKNIIETGTSKSLPNDPNEFDEYTVYN